MLYSEKSQVNTVGQYVPGSGTITHFFHGAPVYDRILKQELEQVKIQIREVVGYYHGMPIYDPDAPELKGGYQED